MLTASELAALDPVAFLRRVPPFHLLPEALFEEAARAMEIAVFAPGTRLVEAGGEPLRDLHVVRRGAVRLERGGQVLQVLEHGEAFGYTSLLSGRASLDVVVEETLLAYCIPAAEFEALLRDARFAAHFAVGLTARLKASLHPAHGARFEPDVGIPVERLVRRPPVWMAPDVTVGEAARVMRDEHVSSVLLRCDPPGIVTDRDLRNRVLGELLGPEVPAARVCSRPLRTLPAATPLYEGWRTFLDAQVNHLPVVRGEEIVGVLTSTDLLRHSAQGPVAVLRRYERIASPAEAAGYGRSVAEMSSALLSAGLDGALIAAFVAQLDEALLRRLLHLAEADLGRPPTPYAWLALGAEGRRERTLVVEQENAVVFADEGEAGRGAFEALAARVVGDLEAAGFRPAPGRVARDLAGTVSEWIRRVDAVAEGRLHAIAGWLDLRRVGGALSVAPLRDALDRAALRPDAARVLAKHALALEPPPVLLLRLRGGSSRVDVERQGLRPIVALARCFAVEVRSRSSGTFDRLDDAKRAGVLSERTHGAVAEAFRFLLGLHLALSLRAGPGHGAPGPVALGDLTALERTRLKDAFRVIHGWQERAAHRYQPDLVIDGRP